MTKKLSDANIMELIGEIQHRNARTLETLAFIIDQCETAIGWDDSKERYAKTTDVVLHHAKTTFKALMNNDVQAYIYPRE